MHPTKPLSAEAELQEERRRNALVHLRQRYAELDRLTGKTAAERFEKLRQRRRAC